MDEETIGILVRRGHRRWRVAGRLAGQQRYHEQRRRRLEHDVSLASPLQVLVEERQQCRPDRLGSLASNAMPRSRQRERLGPLPLALVPARVPQAWLLYRLLGLAG